MGKLFNPPQAEAPPTIDDPEIERERLRQLAARLQGAGRQTTILSGGAGVATPILGTAAQISGGMS